MNLLFIADPLESFKISKDSTLAMMRVAQEAGHQLWFCESRNILWRDEFVVADCRSLDIKPSGTAWFELGPIEDRPLNTFNAVMMRTDPPFNIEYLNTTWLCLLQFVRVRKYLITQQLFGITPKRFLSRNFQSSFRQL